ncbi:unnamed protein product [Acanthoscelides obtectus]|uniref:PiggyBac transposable element-derived protein 4-like n=2 Tax=Acanthoscelides obtectus TaxID=200917 RepID=A0A9P0P6U2_ACAOB|nr:unnamed protein product [Acanthoscelides obtectus]CAH1974723.1 unnamed protein product [Acanthoscelides obtectus]CAK1640009.1 PiggyBac transposable element-derived protein 4 [Acanthoscelides obtectus]CAK1654503.1 PiggyBac transposable element-derived protein 4 [Acanthoscelides obtectus]
MSNLEDNDSEDIDISGDEADEVDGYTSSDETEGESEYEDSGEDTNDETEPEPEPDFEMPWTQNGIPRPAFPFTSNSGVQVPAKSNPLDIFEIFFDESLINLIVEETNRFAIQYIIKNGENIRPHSRVRQWKETNTNEIRTLIGLLILQGLCPKPEYKMYFSRRESIETPFFSKIISEKRFHLLLKFLHFVDNSTINANTKNRKLAKVLPLLNHLREKFMTSYVPERDIAIDESLIGWKGRLGWKQYIPSKRKRFGIKLFALCETSGYMYNFIIYTGADTIYEAQHSQEPVTSRIVLSLVDSLLDKGYRLFLDNYYTSVDLVHKLVKRRTDCVGTIRANRKGIPKDLQVKLSKGQSVARYNRKIMIQKWHDKKDVLMISTLHDKTMEKVLTKKGEIEKPTCVLEYNKKMGGVDLADNYLHYYGTARSRVKKYYMKMFWHFLSVTTLNSFHIYKRNGGRLKRINFLLELGEQIVRKYSSQITFGTRRSRAPMPSRFIERHFPSVIPPTTKQKPTKRCAICAEKKIRKESRYWCQKCHTGLCPAPCFEIFHTK